MKVTRVDMFSAANEEPVSFSLEAENPDAQYQVRTIIGLDADEIIQKFYGQSATGKKFFDFRLKPRDVVLRVVLKPREILGETYSDIRDELYRAISSNRTGGVTLNFNSGPTVVSAISGNILKFESAYFNRTPEVQLTIRCQDPMFRAVNPVIFSPTELGSANPFTIPDTLSTAPHGMSMRMKFTATSPDLTIQDAAVSPEWSFKLVPSGGFLVNDVLYISSEFTNKYAYLVRGASTIQLADVIFPGSVWPIIFPFPNANSFYIPQRVKFNWEDLRYSAAYWGV